MERIRLYQVDAFTDKLFHGNPAALCILQEWLNEELLQAIAIENNLSETAFVVKRDHDYHIRWFSPNGEIDLCGHATLAAAFVLFEQLQNVSELNFSSLSGPLKVYRENKYIVLDFPLLQHEPIPNHVLEEFIDQPIVSSYCSSKDWVIVVENEDIVKKAQVAQPRILSHEMRGLVITAPAEDVDFYSRCFYPKHKIPEDPVTGSAHCILAPIWAERLGKTSFIALQGLQRRGTIHCQILDNRVLLKGECRLFLEGFIEL